VRCGPAKAGPSFFKQPENRAFPKAFKKLLVVGMAISGVKKPLDGGYLLNRGPAAS